MNEVRFVWRGWRRRPLHPIAVVLLLTIGIAANAGVFAVVERLLLSPLAVEDPETLVSFGRLSYPNYRSFADRLAGVSGVAAFANRPLTLTEREPEPVRAAFVTVNYFSVLGVAATRGRTFHPGDPDRVAVVSEPFWRTAWGADPEVVGRTLWLNDRAVTVVGVLPADFQGTTLEYAPNVWVPLSLQPEVRPDLADLRENRLNPWVTVFARRREDTSPARLAQAVASLSDALVTEYPRDNAGMRAVAVVPLTRSALSPDRRTSLAWLLGLLQSAALSVFLVGMANMAILVLVSAESRRGEFAVRLVQGARWWRVVRPQAVEYLILGGVAGAGGIAVTRGALQLLARLRILPSVDVGPYTIGLVAGLALLAPCCAVIVSALRVRRMERSGALHPAAASQGATTRSTWMNAFLAAQTVLSLALVCGALLFVENLRNRMRIDPGFDAEGVLRVRIALREAGYDETAAGLFRRALVREAAALPGTLRAGWGLSIPFGGATFLTDVSRADGLGTPVRVVTNYVDREFFATLGIPIVLGRGFSENERPRGEVVVSRGLAASLWPEEGAIGRRLRDVLGNATYEVVGVAGDTRYRSLDGAVSPVVYFPPNDAFVSGYLLVRSELDPEPAAAAVRQRIRDLDSRMPTHDHRKMEDVLDGLLERDRMVAAGVGTFAVLGLLLAGLGLAGAAARLVGLRRREIGVRLALGARPRDVFLLLLGDGALVLAGGMIGGAGLAAGCWWLVRSQVYGVDTAGMVGTVGEAALLLAAVGLLAIGLPARRAMRVDPAVALRSE